MSDPQKTISELEPIDEISVGDILLALENGTATFSCAVNTLKDFIAIKLGESTSITTAAGTTTLTTTSTPVQIFTGTTTQTVVLPDATTLKKDRTFQIINTSTGIITVNFNGGSLAVSIPSNNAAIIKVLDISTSAGTWILLFLSPITFEDSYITGTVSDIANPNNYSFVSKNASNILFPVIKKSGQVLSADVGSVTFPAAFPNAITNLQLLTRQAVSTQLRHAQVSAVPSESGFSYRVLDSTGSTNDADALYWTAEGY